MPSIWSMTSSIQVTGRFVEQTFTATAGQTAFVLTEFTYLPGTERLWVFINGQKQDATEFTETSSTVVTLNEACDGGETVTCAIIGAET